MDEKTGKISETPKCFICQQGNEDTQQTKSGKKNEVITAQNHEKCAENLSKEHPAGVAGAADAKTDDVIDGFGE